MKRYMIAFKLNDTSKARTNNKEQVKTFEDVKDATTFAVGIASSGTRELISIGYHNFVTHETIPHKLQLVGAKLKLVVDDADTESK